MKYACLAVVLFVGTLAAGEPAPERKESKTVALALKLAQDSLDHADRLERLIQEEGRVEAVIGEIAALDKDLKKARGSVDWAAAQGVDGARDAALKLAEALDKVARKVGKLAGSAPDAAKDLLKRSARRAQRIRKDCERRIAEIDVGGRPDPFGEFMTPKLPAAPENPSRDAQIDTSGHR